MPKRIFARITSPANPPDRSSKFNRSQVVPIKIFASGGLSAKPVLYWARPNIQNILDILDILNIWNVLSVLNIPNILDIWQNWGFPD